MVEVRTDTMCETNDHMFCRGLVGRIIAFLFDLASYSQDSLCLKVFHYSRKKKGYLFSHRLWYDRKKILLGTDFWVFLGTVWYELSSSCDIANFCSLNTKFYAEIADSKLYFHLKYLDFFLGESTKFLMLYNDTILKQDLWFWSTTKHKPKHKLEKWFIISGDGVQNKTNRSKIKPLFKLVLWLVLGRGSLYDSSLVLNILIDNLTTKLFKTLVHTSSKASISLLI